MKQTWGTLTRLAQDRNDWRVFVSALHTTRCNRSWWWWKRLHPSTLVWNNVGKRLYHSIRCQHIGFKSPTTSATGDFCLQVVYNNNDSIWQRKNNQCLNDIIVSIKLTIVKFFFQLNDYKRTIVTKLKDCILWKCEIFILWIWLLSNFTISTLTF